jgi:hypothetical protein
MPDVSASSVDPLADVAGPGAQRVRMFTASDRLIGRVRRVIAAHPYIASSIALHGMLVTLLLNLPGMGEAEQKRAHASDVANAMQQVANTEIRELQRQVAHMEDIQRVLSADLGVPPASSPRRAAVSSPGSLAARAQEVADEIDADQRKSRATRLASLTGMSLAEALHRIDAEAVARRPSATAATPAQVIAHLERQAREALRAEHARAEILRSGTPVTLPTRAQIRAADEAVARAPDSRASGSTGQRFVADGYLRSRIEQLASMTRLGSAQGRVGVVGSSSGLSVNREGVQGVVGERDVRAADTGPEDLGAPVTARGAAIDLTREPVKGSHDLVSYVEPVAIDPAAGHRAAGRTFGRGGIYASHAYVNSWYVIGPFAGQGERSMDEAYPPEQDVDLDGTYRGLGGRVLTWSYSNRGFYPFVPPDRAENAVYYAYTELRIDEARDVWLSIAGDDDTRLWLDGRLVWISAPGDKPWYHPPFYLQDERAASYALEEGQRRVHLARGVHRLLVKLYNDRDRAFFSVVLAP